MNTPSTHATQRSMKSHSSPFQMLLVAVALLSCLIPSGRRS